MVVSDFKYTKMKQLLRVFQARLYAVHGILFGLDVLNEQARDDYQFSMPLMPTCTCRWRVMGA